METQIVFRLPTNGQEKNFDQYERIELETIESKEFKDLTISGALFKRTTFKDVSFNNCVFFGSKIEECRFINCHFNNCSFEFSSISNCNFYSTSFIELHWETSPLKDCLLQDCFLPRRTLFHLGQWVNRVEGCFSNDELAKCA